MLVVTKLIIANCFKELESKYGEDFCWMKVNAEKNSFISEAYREIAQDHPLYGMELTALAKSEANDDVLFYTEHGQFVVIHLTYSESNTSGFPRYKILDTHQELKEYLEMDVQRYR